MKYVARVAAAGDDPLSFVLSDATKDRLGEVIDPRGWVLGNFKRNPIALFNHDSDNVVGVWRNIRIEANKLVADLELAAAGTSALVDMVRELVRQKILRAVSVGFRPLKREPIDPERPYGAQRYTQSELLEASLVSIPANPNALQIAKALGAPDDLVRAVLVQPNAKGSPEPIVVRTIDQSVGTRPAKGTPMKTLSQRIQDAQKSLNDLRDQLTTLQSEYDDPPTEDQITQTEELQRQIGNADRTLTVLKGSETALAARAQQQDPGPGEDDNGRQTIQLPAVAPRSVQLLQKKLEPRDLIVRTAVSMFLAHIRHKSPFDVVKECYGDDEATGVVLRAAVLPATTTQTGWAAELVQTVIADFMASLQPISIYPRLSSMGARYTFGRNGTIRIPFRGARGAGNDLAGDFIGEGAAIPVKKLTLQTLPFTPKKMAVISTFTRELAMHSTPSIESIIREAMADDTAIAIDTKLIDNVAGDAIRPPGLLNGVTPLTPAASGTVSEKIVADLAALVGAITNNLGGRAIAILMNPVQGMHLKFAQTTTGDFLFDSPAQAATKLGVTFIESTTVPAGTLIAVDAADFATATGDAPEYDVSDQATLHMEDTAPLPIVDAAGTAAKPVRSLWQTASIGVRMLLDMNWGMRRAGMVSTMSGVGW